MESKKPFEVGDKVRVHVWRDVIVDGAVVIPRGAPVDAHISFLKTNKIAGVKGKLEIAAEGVTAADGSFVPLSGGYGKTGKNQTALAVGLAAFVFVPLIFIHGRKAKLEPGALFDAYTDQAETVAVERPEGDTGEVPTLNVAGMTGPEITGHILYDELKAQHKPKELPLQLSICGVETMPEVVIDRINGEPTKPLGVERTSMTEKEDCFEGRFVVKLKPLVKRFRRGINRFDVAFDNGGERVSEELILDVQF